MRTSVNLRISDIPELYEKSNKYGLPYSVLICRCLVKLFASHSSRLFCSMIPRLVEYQPDFVGYRIVNVVFDVDTYNLGVNFRAYCRISVSKMVTMALIRFLDEVVSEIEGTQEVINNYVFYYHEISCFYEEFSPEWHIIWRVRNNNEKT